jgi:predicted acylesterase/phospholipase RssA
MTTSLRRFWHFISSLGFSLWMPVLVAVPYLFALNLMSQSNDSPARILTRASERMNAVPWAFSHFLPIPSPVIDVAQLGTVPDPIGRHWWYLLLLVGFWFGVGWILDRIREKPLTAQHRGIYFLLWVLALYSWFTALREVGSLRWSLPSTDYPALRSTPLYWLHTPLVDTWVGLWWLTSILLGSYLSANRRAPTQGRPWPFRWILPVANMALMVLQLANSDGIPDDGDIGTLHRLTSALHAFSQLQRPLLFSMASIGFLTFFYYFVGRGLDWLAERELRFTTAACLAALGGTFAISLVALHYIDEPRAWWIVTVRSGVLLARRLFPGAPASDTMHVQASLSLRAAFKAWLRARTWRNWALVATLVWLLAGIYLYEADFFPEAVTIGAVVLYLRWLLNRFPAHRWIVLGLVVLPLGLWGVGSYNPAVDVSLFLLALLLASHFSRLLRLREFNHAQLWSGLALVLATWIFWSLGDMFLRPAPGPLRPERFLGLRENSAFRDKRIGISLSGGGYRAAVLHAGILAGLEQMKIAVTNISSVSGGSITASYYALGGDPEDFANAVENQRIRIYREMFDVQNVARLILTSTIPGTRIRLSPLPDFTRTDIHAQSIDHVFLSERRFRQLPSESPRLMVCVTDLNTGNAIGVTQNWLISRFLLQPPGEMLFPNGRDLFQGEHRIEAGSGFTQDDVAADEKLSKFVAASGAFPLAFAPVPQKSRRNTSFLFADGGVTDNSGMTLMLEAHSRASLADPKRGDPAWKLDLAISADGGAIFQQRSTTSAESPERAMDIVHSRIGQELPTEAPSASSLPMVLISPAVYVDNSSPIEYSYWINPSEGLRDKSGQRLLPLFRSEGGLSLQERRTLLLVARQIARLDRESLHQLIDAIDVSKHDRQRLQQSMDEIWNNRVAPQEMERLQTAIASGRPLAPADNGLRAKLRAQTDSMLYIDAMMGSIVTRYLWWFLNTSTLSESLDRNQVVILFSFGKALAWLNSRDIRDALRDPGSPSPQGGLSTNAQKEDLDCTLFSEISHSDEEDTLAASSTIERDRAVCLEKRSQGLAVKDPVLSRAIRLLYLNQ